jgi:hypothetical protein
VGWVISCCCCPGRASAARAPTTPPVVDSFPCHVPRTDGNSRARARKKRSLAPGTAAVCGVEKRELAKGIRMSSAFSKCRREQVLGLLLRSCMRPKSFTQTRSGPELSTAIDLILLPRQAGVVRRATERRNDPLALHATMQVQRMPNAPGER